MCKKANVTGDWVLGSGNWVFPSPEYLDPSTPVRQLTDAFRMFSRNYGQAERAIRTSKLNPLPDLHLWPMYVVVFDGPSKGSRSVANGPFTLGRSDLGACFMLRCFQHLSLPDFATQPCHGRDSWYTRGLFIPVLSY